MVDLDLPFTGSWPPVTFGDRRSPTGALCFVADIEPEVCLRNIRDRTQAD